MKKEITLFTRFLKRLAGELQDTDEINPAR